MRRLLATLIAVLLMCVSSAAVAQATVFVPSEQGFAWWARELSFLPLQGADGGLSTQDIDAWIAANRGMRVASRTCFMSFVRDDQIVSDDRQTHDEIRAKLAENPDSFSQTFEPVAGNRFLVRIGVFEICRRPGSADEPLRYMAVVVTDQENRIQDFDALDWSFMRLDKDADGTLSVYGCFNCGERRELAWDQGNNRFYYQWTGH